MISTLEKNLPRINEVLGILTNKDNTLIEKNTLPPWTREIEPDRSNLSDSITLLKNIEYDLSLETKNQPQAVILKVCAWIQEI